MSTDHVGRIDKKAFIATFAKVFEKARRVKGTAGAAEKLDTIRSRLRKVW